MTNSLPPQGPQEPDDLMSGEAELRVLYGKLPQTGPAPALDAAVLRAAAEAVSAERHAIPASKAATAKMQRRSPRWLIGLSSAATLVLAAGLAWRMRSMPPSDNVTPPAEAVSTPATNNAAADESRVSAPAAMLAPAAVPLPPMPARQPPPIPMLEAERSRQSMKAVAEKPTVQATRDQASADIPPPSPPPPAPALEEADSARVPAAAQARSAMDKVAAPPRIQPQVIGAPAFRPPAPAFESSPPAPPAAPAPPAPPQAFAPAQGMIQADESQAQDASPAQVAELDAIRLLFSEHRDEEAQRRLEAFHQLHPQWMLPVDLRARLRKP